MSAEGIDNDADQQGLGSSALFGSSADTGDLHPPGVVSRNVSITNAMPERIGRYSIKRRIGGGGMGVVYEAIQDHPRKTVAVKVMRQGIASRAALRRFEYEAQLMARLRHPGIAQVFEAGTCAIDGVETPYFAMEYVPNARPLTAYADEKKLDARRRLELFALVCDAIAHGHQRGIIHRDLKPANILVDSEGCPKVIDFGVARATDSDLAVTTQQTHVGQLIGTLQYMSPEQCDADPNDLDTRSDVYALGAVLYELLTGSLPYDVSKAALHEATRVIKEQPPARPSSLRRTLRGDAERIVLKALEKDRRDRFQSAGDLATDIRRLLRDEPPVFAHPAGMLERARKFARRHRRPLTVAAAAFAILATAAALSTASAIRANRALAETRAVSDFFLLDVLRVLDPEEPGAIRDDSAPFLAHIGQVAQTQLADRPLLQARVYHRIAALLISIGRLDIAGPFAERALTTLRAEPAATPADLAEALWARAWVLARSPHPDENQQARHLFSEASALARGHALPTPLLARAVQGEAELTARLGDVHAGIALLDGLIDALATAPDASLPARASAHLARARLNALLPERPLDQIERDVDAAETQLRSLPEAHQGKMAYALLQRARLHRWRGEHDLELEAMRQAVAWSEKYRLQGDVALVAPFVEYSSALLRLGRGAESLDAARAGVRIAREVDARQAESREILGRALASLGNAHMLLARQGDAPHWAEAAGVFEECITLWRTANLDADGAAALTMNWIACLIRGGGEARVGEAIALADTVMRQCSQQARERFAPDLASAKAWWARHTPTAAPADGPASP